MDSSKKNFGEIKANILCWQAKAAEKKGRLFNKWARAARAKTTVSSASIGLNDATVTQDRPTQSKTT